MLRQEELYQALPLKTNLDTAKINIFHIHSISLTGTKWAKFITGEKRYKPDIHDKPCWAQDIQICDAKVL